MNKQLDESFSLILRKLFLSSVMAVIFYHEVYYVQALCCSVWMLFLWFYLRCCCVFCLEKGGPHAVFEIHSENGLNER